jgi:N-terminal acetyltransferase 2
MSQTPLFRLGLSTAFRRTAAAFTSTANPVLRKTIQNQAQPLLRSTPFTRTAFRSYRQQSKRHYSSSSAPSSGSLSFTQRLKALSKEYGYTALGVYLLISALDFPVCFVAVRLIGADVVGEYEEKAVGWIRSVLPEGWLKKKETTDEEHVGEDGKKKTSKFCSAPVDLCCSETHANLLG